MISLWGYQTAHRYMYEGYPQYYCPFLKGILRSAEPQIFAHGAVILRQQPLVCSLDLDLKATIIWCSESLCVPSELPGTRLVGPFAPGRCFRCRLRLLWGSRIGFQSVVLGFAEAIWRWPWSARSRPRTPRASQTLKLCTMTARTIWRPLWSRSSRLLGRT